MPRTLLAVTSAIIMLGATSLASHAAGSQSGHFIAEMDRDRNGTVSRAEFVYHASRTFRRLDANRSFGRLDRNHNGSLDRSELRAWSRRSKKQNSRGH
jgi:Ca2+-binding EF-hand superfamily protein